MKRMWLSLGLMILAMGCKDPMAPMVPMCQDDYSPASCMDGEEECETDDNGCRVCTCKRDEAPPKDPLE